MEFVSAPITPVVELLLVPVKRQLGFLFSSTQYDRDMRTRIRELNSTAIDMKERMEESYVRNLMVPHHVPIWLEQAEAIVREVDSISVSANGYLNMKRRYKAGKQCFNIIKDIDRLMRENLSTEWTNEQIPLGMASSATPQILQDDTQYIFKSRQLIFQRALHLLEPDNPTQMVALCGMGGIGKTTMMEELKKVVENMKLFDRVQRVVMGKSADPIAFQEAIAQYTGGSLSESTKEARADRLKGRFLGMSQDGKKKILIILDDLWNIVDLKDIGLATPLPKGFKLFLTSRDERLCGQMDVETSSILRMYCLEEAEAKQLFFKTTGLSDEAGDQELHKLGEGIVKRCGGLPMAIKTIALALKGEIKDAWKLTLSRLERHDLQDLQGRYDVVHDIFEISYNRLKNNDDKKIFILSGLFPDDFDIPLEDLMRYGWGLQLFDNVYSLVEARRRSNTSVHNLIRENLLVESDRKGCVKMHDLARSFVLSNISKFKQASIANYRDMSEWPTQDKRESCERILVQCKGIFSEFPRHFYYPCLKLLKLMVNSYEKEPLKFPDDFYTRMKQLQVISYRSIEYPSLPISSPQCSTTSLRMLCLRSCSLNMGDLSYLGHLSNLEILSFAYCRIKNLPSDVGKLRKLKLLDLTGCDEICNIHDGVFQNLDNLKELYIRNGDEEVTSFTQDNCEGLEMVSKKLTALEIEFYKNIIRPDNVSFKKLERFRISIGCKLDPIYENDVYSFENTLRLVCSLEEVCASGISELFEKTEKLHLQVEDMNHLKDVLMHPSNQYSFFNLKHLSIERCTKLKYLFTVNVASTLTNLERLTVWSCGSLGSLIHDEKNGAEVIKFHNLKRLVLEELPMFVGLCDNINIVMELPQLVELRLGYLPKLTCIFASSNNISAKRISLLIKEVVCRKLDELEIRMMKNLKEIWACEEEDDRTPVFKQIKVEGCDDIQNLFPKNPMRLLSHLETLEVRNCGSNIQALFDIDSARVRQVSSSLRSIRALGLRNLREVWRIRDEENSGLLILDFQALESIEINDCEYFMDIVTPTTIKFNMGALVAIIESSGYKWVRHTRSVELIQDVEEKCKKIIKAQQCGVAICEPRFSGSWSLYQYSKEIEIRNCHALSTVIPSYASEQLQIIEVLKVYNCSSVMEVFETKNSPVLCQKSDGRDDTTLAEIPRIKSISMHNMPNLKELDIHKCHRLVDIFTFSILGSLGQLKKLSIKYCKQLKVIVREEHGEQTRTKSKAVTFPCLKSIILDSLPNLKGFFLGMNEFELPLMNEVTIKRCSQMMVFTSLPVRAPKLGYIHINDGKYTPSLITLHQAPSQSLDKCFHSLIHMNLKDYQERQVIFSYDELLQLQNLETLSAAGRCDRVLEVFDIGTGEGRCSNSSQTVVKLPKLSDVYLWSLESLKYIWRSNGQTILEFPNLTKLNIYHCDHLEHVFTSSMVGSLLQLKDLSIDGCRDMEVIVKEDQEEEEEGDGKVNEIRLPCLKSLQLIDLDRLKGFCLGNVDYSFPSLDSMKIYGCKSLKTFTKGRSCVPELKVMDKQVQALLTLQRNKKSTPL